MAVSRRLYWLLFFGVLSFTLVLFARTLGFGLYYDDNHHARPWGLGEVLGTFYGPFDPLGIEPPYFRPLLVVTFALDWSIWGWSPWGYHLTNVLLHAGSAALVLTLLLRMGAAPLAALAGGLYFALIPANVATAVYISERSDALVAIFTCAALCCVHAYVQSGRRRWVWAVGALSAAAMASKELGVSAALLAPLFWFYFELQRRSLTQPAARLGWQQLTKTPAALVRVARDLAKEPAARSRALALTVPLVLLVLCYAVYRTLVLPTGLISAKYGDVGPLRGYASALIWTFRAVPWELHSHFILPALAVLLALALWSRPGHDALGLLAMGFSTVAVSAAPLGLLGQVEPRLLYLPEVGHALVFSGIVTALGRAAGRRPLSLISGVSLALFLAAVSLAHLRAQDEFGPDSYKMLKGYRLVIEDPKKDLYPRQRLEEIHTILESARARGLDGAL
jgi:hypothetical protein